MDCGLRLDTLSNVSGVQIAAIMFKACHTIAVTDADCRMPSYEPNVAACQIILWNLSSHISGNFLVKGQCCQGSKGAGQSATEELTLLPVILLPKQNKAPEE